MINVQIEKSWFTQLSSEFEKDYMRKLSLFLKEEKNVVVPANYVQRNVLLMR